MTTIWIITGGVFVFVLAASFGLYGYLAVREDIRTWRRRADQTGAIALNPGPDTWLALWQQKLTEFLKRVGAATKPKDDAEISAVRKRLVTAGYRRAHAPLLFYGVKLLCALVLLIVASLIPLSVLGFPATTKLLLFYTVGASAGYYLPNLWLSMTIRERQEKLRLAVPDSLDMLVVCVEAGLGLDMAVARVGDEIKFTHKELGEEFHLLALELRTGVNRQDALRNLAQRTDLEDLKTLVALLVQTDRFGTSIGQALRVHADSMRVNRRLRAEAMAAKLPVKLLFPLIFFIFPSLFIVILGPAAIKIVRVLFPMARQTTTGF